MDLTSFVPSTWVWLILACAPVWFILTQLKELGEVVEMLAKIWRLVFGSSETVQPSDPATRSTHSDATITPFLFAAAPFAVDKLLHTENQPTTDHQATNFESQADDLDDTTIDDDASAEEGFDSDFDLD